MFKNMRVSIAYCMSFNPGRKMATGFTSITGITSRTGKPPWILEHQEYDL